MNEDATDLRIRRPDEATRRAFITRAVAMGASVAAASSLWDTGAHSAPVKGGHLRLGVAGATTTDTLDPSPWSDTFMVMVGYSTRGSLVELAPDGTLRPELAESWSASPDASVWTFNLRKGAEFSNGKTVTAEDAVSYTHLTLPTILRV